MVIISYKILECKRRTADYMPALLVDYENVNGSNGLKGVDALCEKDTLIIFYSNCCTRIRYDHMQDIIESGCKY